MTPRFLTFALVPAVAAVWFAAPGVALVTGQAPAVPPSADAAPPYAFAEPGIAPDGREIAFASGGDLWVVPAAGGDAHLVVADAATERRPMYSPDGRHLAFMSDRTGGGDIYVLTFATGAVARVTWDDGADQLDGWSRDSQWIYFSATGRDIAGMNDVYRIRRSGGTPMAVSADRYVNEFSAAPAPDGRRVAIVARGIASGQWWRRGSSHIDQSEIWLLDLEAPGGPGAYAPVRAREARQIWPMWNADGRALFYVSDAGGAENIWTAAVAAGPDAAARKLTSFRAGRVLWPTITADGRTIAFERDFGVWTLDTATGAARALPIARRGAVPGPAPERVRQTNQFRDLALSPDGRKIVFVARGDLFAASARDGGDATRVTDTDGIESQPAWAPDSRRIAFASARGQGQQLYLYDFQTTTESALTTGETTDLSPVFSPDGRRLAFLRDRRELVVLDLEGRTETRLSTGVFADTIDSPRPVWSPDGRWVALFVVGTKGFTNVEIVSVEGGPRRPVSFLANVFADTIAWSPDGTFILFDTGQRTESGRLARVDLTLRTPKLREDLFRDLFTTPTQNPRPADAPPVAPPQGPPATPPATPLPTPVAVPPVTAPAPSAPVTGAGRGGPVAARAPAPRVDPIFEAIHERLSLLPLGLDVGEATISPDGKTAVVVATSAGRSNLYAYSLDELATERPVARQLTTTAGGKADPQFTTDGREVYFLDAGRVQIVTVESRQARPLAVTAEMVVDFAREKHQVFREAWTLLRDNFFDANFNGVDWNESLQHYGVRAAAAATPDELRRVISLMIGDLNASHLGISGGGGGGPITGRLGLAFDRRAWETSTELRVTSVVPLGPAALTRAIAPGDVIESVNGRAIDAGVNLDEVLQGTIDRRVVLRVRSPSTGSGQGGREVVVRPINQASEKALLYRAWVNANREFVLQKSGGRLGYVHMINMSAGALDQLMIDLDTRNHAADGVVVDMRNNNGGFVNAYALDVFARRPYLRMSTRILPEAPARGMLGQRALELATVLVTNQHSLSDAEDFTEGYRALKLGSIVGEPTAGWIIYTWNRALVDGSTLRLPRMRIRGADGTDMEMAPRPVDVPVSRALGESLTGEDAQLEQAIRTLLQQLGRAEAPEAGGK